MSRMRRGAFILILALCLAVAAFAQSAVQFLPVPANMTFGALVSVSRYGTFVLGSATDGNGVTHYLLWGPNLGAAPQDLSKAAGPTPASPVPYDGVFTAAEAADAGRIAPGDAVLVSGFGAGMTWGSTVFRWGI